MAFQSYIFDNTFKFPVSPQSFSMEYVLICWFKADACASDVIAGVGYGFDLGLRFQSW